MAPTTIFLINVFRSWTHIYSHNGTNYPFLVTLSTNQPKRFQGFPRPKNLDKDYVSSKNYLEYLNYDTIDQGEYASSVHSRA